MIAWHHPLMNPKIIRYHPKSVHHYWINDFRRRFSISAAFQLFRRNRQFIQTPRKINAPICAALKSPVRMRDQAVEKFPVVWSEWLTRRGCWQKCVIAEIRFSNWHQKLSGTSKKEAGFPTVTNQPTKKKLGVRSSQLRRQLTVGARAETLERWENSHPSWIISHPSRKMCGSFVAVVVVGFPHPKTRSAIHLVAPCV